MAAQAAIHGNQKHVCAWAWNRRYLSVPS